MGAEKLGCTAAVGQRITGDSRGQSHWAYAQPFQASAKSERAMRPWLHGCNTARPLAASVGKPPLPRLPNLAPKDNFRSSDS